MESHISKRSVSPSVTASAQSKKPKLVDNLFGFFGLNLDDSSSKMASNGSLSALRTKNSNDEGPSMAKFNRFRSEQLGHRNVSDITALKLYHDSLKRQNTQLYKELLGETIPPQRKQNGDGTAAEDYDMTGNRSDRMTDDNNDDSNNSVINLNNRGIKRPFKESRDSSLIVPSTLKQRQLSIPALRRQISRINPRERSNLINLKRKMKLDAYYRRKMNYLNYYNQNSANNSTMDYSMMSANSSTFMPHEERKTLLDLNSTKKLKNVRHVDKKRKTRIDGNVSGLFNGSLMYDLDDDEEEKNADSSISFKPVNISVKETDGKYKPKGLTPGLENILGGQKKKQLVVTHEKEPQQDQFVKPVLEKPSELKKDRIAPSSGFSFVNSDKVTELPSVPTLTNPMSVPETKPLLPAATSLAPKFSFGSSLPAQSSNSTSESAPKPQFSFSTATKPDLSKADLSKTDLSKPELPKPAGFSFGTGSSDSKTPAIASSKPLFGGLNSKLSEDKPDKLAPGGVNGFSFGTKEPAATETTSATSDKPSLPKFSFGAPKTDSADKPDTKESASAAPAATKSFSFGAAAQNASSAAPSGASSGAPSFSFAAKSDANSAKPAFSFGGSDSGKPQLSFALFSANNTSLSKKEEANDDEREESERKRKVPTGGASTSGFQFGASDSTANKVESPKPKPLFNFNTNAATGFSFGSKPAANGTEPSLISATPSVTSESGVTAQPAAQNAAKPAFTFNTTSATGGFGSASAASSKDSTPLAQTAPVAANASTKFNFGALTKPVFNVLGTETTTTASPFSGSGRTTPNNFAGATNGSGTAQPKPAFQFGMGAGVSATKADPASVFGNVGSVNNLGSGFNFGANAQANDTKSVGSFNPSRSATPGSFNFTGSATTVNPSSVFGLSQPQQQPQQQQPASVFGGFGQLPPAQLQPGNLFGGNGTPNNSNMFGGFGNNQPQGGQPNLFSSGSPAPTSGTPIPGRKIARMRLPRSHR